MHAAEMIASHPHVQGHTNDALVRCIEACFECAQSCTACADACLGESTVAELTQCIRLNLDCADVCQATGSLASRRTGSDESLLKTMLQACAEACRRCGDECSRHAQHHRHCAVCAASCKRCEDACVQAAATITPTRQ
jgi:hypothetical protein